MKSSFKSSGGGYYGGFKVVCVLFLVFSAMAHSAAWMSSSYGNNQSGVYGTQGRPLPDKMPNACRESVSWVDAAGDFWLFGGWNDMGYLNDLWKFDGTNWTWVSGARTASQPGVYGTRGVAAAGNVPGARGAAISWTDRNGNFWLFGGSGYADSSVWGLLNDLWKYDGTNWTWVSGSSIAVPHGGVYGTMGVAAGQNMPGARYGGVSWIDHDGNLWLFGGWGYDGMTNAGWMNDLWKFDGTNWTWVSGAPVVNQPGFYGTQGQAAAENMPGSRWGSVAWIDSNDNLWLFGGAGNWGMNFNDLWKFDGEYWTWVSGAPIVNQPGFYGSQGVADAQNVPGARDHGIGCIDANDNLWLFGGWSSEGYFNDLWKFDGTNWTWVAGSNYPNQGGNYGTQGQAAADNLPAARWADAAWIDADGNLWLFGGWNGADFFNDLWNLGSVRSTSQLASQ
jgi:hypothetical protein